MKNKEHTNFDKKVGELTLAPWLRHPCSNDLSKLSKEVQEDFTKKTDFNTLKTKVDGIDTTKFVLKTKYDSEVGVYKQIRIFSRTRVA